VGDRLEQKCTVPPECMCASDWFIIPYVRLLEIQTATRKIENKQDLLVKEVVRA